MKIPDGYLHRAAKATMLPQYSYLEVMTNRFLDAAHTVDEDIRRAQNIPGTRKTVDQDEISLDNLEFFIRKKEIMAADFMGENYFTNIFMNGWKDTTNTSTWVLVICFLGGGFV
jgi:hypothetical protein